MTRVRAQLDILSGRRAGEVLFFDGDAVMVGRHPDADLRFDPERELAVSAHHAVLVRKGDGWHLRDLSSRNGTFLNGGVVQGEVPIASGDRITFGFGGPEVEFRVTTGSVRVGVPGTRGESSRVRNLPTAERLRVELARQARGLRWLSVALVAGLLLVTVVFFQTGRTREAGWQEERLRARATIDSLLEVSAGALETLDTMEGEVEGLNRALREARDEVVQARTRLASAEDRQEAGDLNQLRRELQSATQALTRHQLAATTDFGRIERANRPALARVYVEMAGGEVVTATAFSVRSDAVLVTNRHVVAGEDGTGEPSRVAVQFADSEQVWPARVVLVARDADLAVLKVDNIEGRVPIIRGFVPEGSLPEGSPVAIIGFPLGGDVVPAEGRVVRPVIGAGLVLERSERLLTVQGYGARGASGSPVFDEEGYLLGVLFGGVEDAGRHTVHAVPAEAARRLVELVP